jgi:hypothetical protein
MERFCLFTNNYNSGAGTSNGGRKSTENDTTSECYAKASEQEICDAMEDMTMENHHIKIPTVAHKMGISVSTAFTLFSKTTHYEI